MNYGLFACSDMPLVRLGQDNAGMNNNVWGATGGCSSGATKGLSGSSKRKTALGSEKQGDEKT
jgi:hypothetical protein